MKREFAWNIYFYPFFKNIFALVASGGFSSVYNVKKCGEK